MSEHDSRPAGDSGPGLGGGTGGAGPPGVGDADLIVASNRQPYRHEYDDDGALTVDAPAGGLTAGLDPAIQRVGGTWIAWGDGEADAEAVDEDDRVAVPPEDPSYDLERLWLSESDVEEYYYGFSNRVLWPVCHAALSNVSAEAGFFERYREVNERFAEAVVDAADEDSVVWFQDYHLALAPDLARERLPESATVMQFWHVPWPSWDVFRACPHRRDLLDGLLGNDLLGFHVERYCENFRECVEAEFDDATVDPRAGTVTRDGHVTRLIDVPLGVPVGDIERRTATPAASSFWSSFTRRHDLGGTVAVGVDRLDYSKGIPERLRALERFFERYPEWRGRLSYVQNGSESRSRIDAYEAEQERVAAAVERVNERFGTAEWDPVVATRDHLSQAELAGLYHHGDLALVSPLRDGMNLVAQEYVAAQTDDDGALLLSEQAGAHDSLGDLALTVTPTDPDSFAGTIHDAVTMSAPERRVRMQRLRRRVSENDLSAWLDRQLRAARHLRDPAERAAVEVRG